MSKLSSPDSPPLDLSPSSRSSTTKPAPQGCPAPAPPRKRLGLTSGIEKNGAKKLTLKPKARPTTTQDGNTATLHSLTTLTRAVRAIQSRPPQPTPESLQVLYSLCEAAVAKGNETSQTLYDKIRMEIERYSGVVRGVLEERAAREEDEGWLDGVRKEWEEWERGVLLIRSVVLGLDRTYVLRSPGLLSIWDLGSDIFRHSVIEHPSISPRLTSSLLSVIHTLRTSTTTSPQSTTLLRSIITHLSSLSSQTHSMLFATPFLASSRAFYKEEGERLSGELKAEQYLRNVEKRLEEEGERYLAEMIKEDQRENLRSVYSLLSRVNALTVLRTTFLQNLKDAGLSLVMDKSSDDHMVPHLIAFRTKAVEIVNDAFGNDQSFAQAVTQAFEFFVNKRENKPAEMMAKFLDAKLRSGNRSMDDEGLENVLKDVLFLFRFTQGKDIFEAFYKRDLAKRLLLNKSASFDAERSMLLKLKDECGAGFTQKLEIMFKDIELSQDVMRAYTTSRDLLSSKPSFDLSVNVLSTANWPTYPPTTVRLPSHISTALEKFKTFYVAKHSGRSLGWQHSLDTCSLKAVFPKGGRKELSVSGFQAVVLLLFNEVPDGGRLSFEEIVEATNIDKKEAARTLQSLACGKVRVLLKHPKGREVDPGDHFAFNTEFKDDHIKIRINQIQQKETAEENKSTTDRVVMDRSSHLELAIVRIMKARKTLKYTELIMEVVSQIGTRFKVEPSEIKKTISSLIDREYLRRADGQQNVFEYLA
ncbi:cullin 4 [Pseudohyphozyma bogoriensis]|nr:cullin 4 [Pseudohyphozyma bogoriensis]